MHARADRPRSGPAVVYLSASRRRQATAGWQQMLEKITAALPAGVWLDTFTDAFPGGAAQYRGHWLDYAADLDGLIVIGEQTGLYTYLLGPGGRAEVRTVIEGGLPVLVFTEPGGLIPIVDCKAERAVPADPATDEAVTSAGSSMLLTVPQAYLPSSPTRHAALQALSLAADHAAPSPNGTSARLGLTAFP